MKTLRGCLKPTLYILKYNNIKYALMYYYYNSNATKVMRYYNGVTLFVTRHVISLELFPSNENVMNIFF